jgi:hypothetical protein
MGKLHFQKIDTKSLSILAVMKHRRHEALACTRAQFSMSDLWKYNNFWKHQKWRLGAAMQATASFFMIFSKNHEKLTWSQDVDFWMMSPLILILFQNLIYKNINCRLKQGPQTGAKMTYMFMSFLVRFLVSTFGKVRSVFEGCLRRNRYFQNANFQTCCWFWSQNGAPKWLKIYSEFGIDVWRPFWVFLVRMVC